MAQKIARLHIAREPGYLYFVKDSAVFATPIKGGKAKGGRKKVATFSHDRDNAFMYFLDKDGDVARAARKSGGRRKKASKAKAPKARATKAPRKARKTRAVKATKGERAQARASMASVLRDMKGMSKRLR